MKQLFPDLWETREEHPFHGVTTHAYLLTQDRGNALFYSTGIGEELLEIQRLGGVSRQYLSHRDEAGQPLATIKKMFGNQLCCDALEVNAISQYSKIDVVFEGPSVEPDKVEVIQTPGHTAGSTCFVFCSPHGPRYLFTGDLIYPEDDGWGTLVQSHAGGQKKTLCESLMKLREVSPDVVISSASVRRSAVQAVTSDQWRAVIDQAVARS
ncbi:MBL fold metallo-hydrolase [Dyella flagellata]|uniref:MBL fold metallo-hydrolase n=1 Tax=Dyella flagellata TaxID=1867833 RepID=A0ABQ5XBL8_9GAMM|nr:MBL fold metallo-hydrolase [Dyella flagellata]GLQ89043.1 MBL fold metallo-hydrolase [Dyella flagellata]